MRRVFYHLRFSLQPDQWDPKIRPVACDKYLSGEECSDKLFKEMGVFPYNSYSELLKSSSLTTAKNSSWPSSDLSHRIPKILNGLGISIPRTESGDEVLRGAVETRRNK